MLVRPYTEKIANDDWVEAHPGYEIDRKGDVETNIHYLEFEHSKNNLRVPPPPRAADCG